MLLRNSKGESVLSINRLDDDDQVANTCTMYSINSTAPYAFGNYGGKQQAFLKISNLPKYVLPRIGTIENF